MISGHRPSQSRPLARPFQSDTSGNTTAPESLRASGCVSDTWHNDIFCLYRRLGPEPPAIAGDVLGHGRAQPRSRNTDSTLSVAKRSISSARDCKASAIRRVETLPRQTWITCGGWPRTKAQARKSLSLVTMANPSAFARVQIRSSSSPATPTSRTWQLPEKRDSITSTRRNERFWSSRAFTRLIRAVAVPVPPRRLNRHGRHQP